jgi:hypothetical protein
MRRWAWLAVLLVLPACKPPGTWDYAAGRPRRRVRENDRLGALPHRPPPPGTVPVQPVSRALRVETRADEFTGDEMHVLEIHLGQSESFVFLARTGFETSRAIYSVTNERWRYLECHHVHGLADDYRITPTGTEHDGRVGTRAVGEHISFSLSLADLEAMSQASRIRFRVCSTVIELPRGTAAAVADLLGRVRPREIVLTPDNSSP